MPVHTTVTPPQALKFGLSLIATEEEMRMESLGIPFHWNERCFHYLIPAQEDGDASAAGDSKPRKMILISCLYSRRTKKLIHTLRTPLESSRGWEARARRIGSRLTCLDPENY